MLTGLQGDERKPTYALMVSDRNDIRGTALWSDPDPEKVAGEAKYRNDRLAQRGKAPRYHVEKRYPVSLAMVFSGDGSAFSSVLEKTQEARKNGC